MNTLYFQSRQFTTIHEVAHMQRHTKNFFEIILNDTYRNNDINNSKQTGYIPYRTAAAPASQHLHGTLRSKLMTTH